MNTFSLPSSSIATNLLQHIDSNEDNVEVECLTEDMIEQTDIPSDKR